MTPSEPRFQRLQRVLRIARRGGGLPVWIVVGLLMALLPSAAWHAPRRWMQTALAPGDRLGAAVRRQAADWIRPLHATLARRAECSQLEAELAAAAARNQQLEVALWQLHDRLAATAPAGEGLPAEATTPLVGGRLIEARILGATLGAWLVRQPIVDLPRAPGYAPGMPLIDAQPPLLDTGADHGLEAGQMVLCGRRVWGQLAEVYGHTATVRRLTDADYRDVVYLAHPSAGRLEHTAEGLWQGTGEPLARVRLVELSVAVELGDLVFAKTHVPAAGAAWLYGHVVRVEHAAEATHWEIWVQPAVSGPLPDRLCVFVPRLHPDRLVRTVEPTPR
jgi:cell shape-determining protein MreC